MFGSEKFKLQVMDKGLKKTEKNKYCAVVF